MNQIQKDSLRLPDELINLISSYCEENKINLIVVATPAIGMVLMATPELSPEMTHVTSAELLLSMITGGQIREAQIEANMSELDPKGVM